MHRSRGGVVAAGCFAFVVVAVGSPDARADKKLHRPMPTSGTSSGTGMAPVFVPTTTKYKDTGKKPGTGKAGSASLTARALLDKSNKTELEVTTGTLDTTNAPGTLEKIQIKALNGAGEVVFTQNENKAQATGYAKLSFTNLRRGQEIQVQANVKGIDPKRMDVVNVKETVKLRPDLKAFQLAAPTTAFVHQGVTISASVAEINGDVGATGDCVLYVDGKAVDRATGVWVDAGGEVSCAFTYKFATIGTKKVDVAVEGVVPGDWDTGNQKASATIEIVEPTKPLNFWASAYDYDINDTSRSETFYKRADGSYPATADYKGTWSQTGWSQGASLSGWTQEAIGFPLKKLEASQSIDGRLIDSVSLSDVGADWSWTWTEGANSYDHSCASRYSAAYNSSVYVCSYRYKYGSTNYTHSNVSYSRWAGDVTYYSAGYGDYWGLYGSGTRYSWNYSGRNARGVREAMGGKVDLVVAVTNATGTTYKAAPSIAMQAYNYASSYPWSCSEYTWSGGYGAKYCGEYSYKRAGKNGWTAK